MTHNIEKMAAEDAKRWAAAEMFFGEGAGTRRKLLNAEIAGKMADPVYTASFDEVYAGLNMTKFAEQAVKERKRIDRAAKVGKNIKALRSGRMENLSTGVFVAVGVAYVLHTTGYDKVIEAEVKRVYRKAKAEVSYRRHRATVTDLFEKKD